MGGTSDLHVILIPNPLNERMNNIFKKIDKLIKSRYELDYWSYINTFFCPRVSNNKNIYKISSAYCNALLKLSENNGHNIDGILYTSVQDGSGYNITLFPNVVNEKLFLHYWKECRDKHHKTLPAVVLCRSFESRVAYYAVWCMM